MTAPFWTASNYQGLVSLKSTKRTLADFGVSAQLENTLGKANTVIGTPLFMSPEILEGKTYGENGMSSFVSLSLCVCLSLCVYACPCVC